MKFELHYDCKHYFGFITVSAASETEAKNKLIDVLATKHPQSFDSCEKVNRDCSHACGLKIKDVIKKD